jgi:hypothetical protein
VPSWPNEDSTVSKRLELACSRILTLLSEIAAKIEYIDFGWPPDRLRIARIRGYPARAGIETRGATAITSQTMGDSGNSAWAMTISSSEFTHNGIKGSANRLFVVLAIHRPTGCTQNLRTSPKLSSELDGIPVQMPPGGISLGDADRLHMSVITEKSRPQPSPVPVDISAGLVQYTSGG